MNTYQLFNATKKNLDRLLKTKTLLKCHSKGSRCVVLVKKALTEEDLKPFNIHAHHTRDCYKIVLPWALTTIMAELTAEYETQRRASPAARQKVIDRWAELSEEVARSEHSLARLKERSEKASRMMVRTFGKSPVAVNDDHYSPSHQGETVFYLKRNGG